MKRSRLMEMLAKSRLAPLIHDLATACSTIGDDLVLNNVAYICLTMSSVSQHITLTVRIKGQDHQAGQVDNLHDLAPKGKGSMQLQR